MENLLILIPLFPLLGFLVNGPGSGKLPKGFAGAVGSLSSLASFAATLALTFQYLQQANGKTISVSLWSWIASASWNIDFCFSADPLTICMLLVVTGVGFLIHIFSLGYMHEDEGFGKFFAFLNLFLFSMLVLVLGGNLLMTFIGWEGVGLCSFLLIGFWNRNEAYNQAARKAFVMNRIGDLGFLIGIFILLLRFGTVQYTELVAELGSAAALNDPLLALAAFCLFVGAMGKSAQLPLFTWLPDAMAGPTPVSALIHAATMVTSGIYLVIRMNALYSAVPVVQEIILWVGLATALTGALIGTSQHDIKKILAYSTVSQLGFMFVALGAGAYTAALFHVITHAFFKALLFLGAGSVIHGLHEEQDIRRMGGLRKALPVTYLTFFIANLAIAGLPPFSGFFSKDEILAHTFAGNKAAWILLTFTAGLTAFYMFRLFFLVFFTSYRGHVAAGDIHEGPLSMKLPLLILALLSAAGGFIGVPEVFHMPHFLGAFLEPVLQPTALLHSVHPALHHTVSHSEEWLVMGVSVLVSVAGIGLAWMLYIQRRVLPPAEASASGLARLLENRLWIDEIYGWVVVMPVKFLAHAFSFVVDLLMINLSVEATGMLTRGLGSGLKIIQSGRASAYAYLMIWSVVVFALLFLFRTI